MIRSLRSLRTKWIAVPMLMVATVAVAKYDDLNQTIAKLLSPFNNATTVAQLVLDNIATSAERALSVNAKGVYQKTGSQNTLRLAIDEVSYSYGDGSAPTTRIRTTLGLNLLKLISQSDINELAPDAEEFITSILQDAAKEYGPSVSITAKVLDKSVDAAGDLNRISIRVEADIDLANLPAPKTSDDEAIRKIALELSIGRDGAAIDVTLVSNPNYKGFRADEAGLKEILERLQAGDLGEIQKAIDFFAGLDELAQRVVEMSL